MTTTADNETWRFAVVNARHASGLLRQQRLDHAPLEVDQIVSAHADA
jgi:hypothetical protein